MPNKQRLERNHILVLATAHLMRLIGQRLLHRLNPLHRITRVLVLLEPPQTHILVLTRRSQQQILPSTRQEIKRPHPTLVTGKCRLQLKATLRLDVDLYIDDRASHRKNNLSARKPRKRSR